MAGYYACGAFIGKRHIYIYMYIYHFTQQWLFICFILFIVLFLLLYFWKALSKCFCLLSEKGEYSNKKEFSPLGNMVHFQEMIKLCQTGLASLLKWDLL